MYPHFSHTLILVYPLWTLVQISPSLSPYVDPYIFLSFPKRSPTFLSLQMFTQISPFSPNVYQNLLFCLYKRWSTTPFPKRSSKSRLLSPIAFTKPSPLFTNVHPNLNFSFPKPSPKSLLLSSQTSTQISPFFPQTFTHISPLSQNVHLNLSFSPLKFLPRPLLLPPQTFTQGSPSLSLNVYHKFSFTQPKRSPKSFFFLLKRSPKPFLSL